MLFLCYVIYISNIYLFSKKYYGDAHSFHLTNVIFKFFLIKSMNIYINFFVSFSVTFFFLSTKGKGPENLIN